MPVTLRLEGAEPLARALRRSPELVAAESLRAMTASLLLVEGDARRNVRHDTRRLMNSITHRVRGQAGSPGGTRLVGEVGPSVRYGLYVERGSRPHWPPVAALVGWARRHGVSPYAVQRGIARRGTRARPFLLPAFTKNADRIVRLFARAGQQVVVRLGGVT
jgi:hypothetical protein